MKVHVSLMFAAGLAMASAGAAAQMFQCRQADGRPSFQQMPCGEGQAPVVAPPADAPPARNAAPAGPRNPAVDPAQPTRRARDLLDLAAAFERCRRDQPGFAEKSAAVHEAWQRRHGAMLVAHERLLATKVWSARYGATARSLHLCTDEWLASLEALARMPDDRFTSVERTWAAFVGALRSADRGTVLNCLAGDAQARWKERVEQMSDEDLKRAGAAMRTFKVQWGDDYAKEGLVTGEDNRLATVGFVRNVNEEWKISDL